MRDVFATPRTGPSPRMCPLLYPDMIRAFEAVMSLTDDIERKNKIQKLKSDYRNQNWITARLMVELYSFFLQFFGVKQYILKSRTNVAINELVQEETIANKYC